MPRIMHLFCIMKVENIVKSNLSSSDFSHELVSEECYERRLIIINEFKSFFVGVKKVEIDFNKNERNGKPVYIAKLVSRRVLLDYLNRYFQRRLEVKVSNRSVLIGGLKAILKDTSPMKVFRSDFEGFYESVDREILWGKILAFGKFKKRELFYLKVFFDELDRQNVNGLPRGVSLSATLAEFYLKEFDQQCTELNGVFFYGRYVDDFIVVSLLSKTIKGLIENQLPAGLSLNKDKTKELALGKATENSEGYIGEINFLGYKFDIFNRKLHRRRVFDVSISEVKVKALKTKIVLCYRDFCKNKNFPLLVKRMEYITGNVILPNKFDNRELKTGIFYNYQEMTDRGVDSLKELDSFMKMIIFSSGCRVVSVSTTLNKQQKQVLRKYSFSKGFSHRFTKKLSFQELKLVTKCF